MQINDILQELHKRRQGHLFGGPSVDWCRPHDYKQKFIKIEGNEYSGCSKYASCDQIDEVVKWTKWEDLTHEQKETLRDCHCYRASIIKNTSNRSPSWDSDFNSVRKENPWIGNPFGIRHTGTLKEIYVNQFDEKILPRDKYPCKIGGCTTPEMQADCQKSSNLLNQSTAEKKEYWMNINACPYFYRSKDEKLVSFEKNIARFAQCFVTQHDIRNLLKQNGFITGAPLFREVSSKTIHFNDIFWYPFFSGYSYVQLLYQTNSDPGWKKFSAQLRWHATSIQRANTDIIQNKYLPNTKRIFEKCEKAENLPVKYEQQRFLDVCDGYASWLLLTWVLLQRIKAKPINIYDELPWEYIDGYHLYSKLVSLGFENEIAVNLKLQRRQEKIFRTSKLDDDLRLLGIYEDNESSIPTKRYEYLVTWLKKRHGHEKAVKDLVDSLKNNLNEEKTLTPKLFFEHFINHVINIEKDHKLESNFKELLVLNPPVHIIVRAFLTFPIRWCFIPFNTDISNNTNNKSVSLTSGMILLIEDSLESKAYKSDISDKDNVILKRFNNMFPLLSSVNAIEEQNLRDEETKKRKEAEIEKEKHATRAAISQVMARNMSHNIGSHVLSKLLTKSTIEKIKKDKYQCSTSTKGELGTTEALIADFFSYLKTRMDFLADITTNTPVMENSKGFNNDITAGFLRNRVLNDRICGISNFSYEIIICNNKNKNICDNLTSENCKSKLQDVKEINVSIPNDVLGNHAFYTILENIIRNTAKHGSKNNIQFHIKIEEAKNLFNNKNVKNLIDQLNELYAVSIFDNSPIENTEVEINLNDKLERKRYHSWLSVNNGSTKMTKLQKLVYDQNYRLNESVLDEDGKLRQGAWGLIEMDASSAYLRKIPIELIDSDEYELDLMDENSITTPKKNNSEIQKINILKAYAEQGKYLGYRFFISKPQEILIIGESHDIFENINPNIEELITKLNNEGIWILNDYKIDEKRVYPHKLVVVTGNKSLIIKKIEKNPRFSKRILQYDKTTEIINSETEIWNIKKALWNLYYSANQLLLYQNDDMMKSDRIIPDNLKSKIDKKRALVSNHGKGYCNEENNYAFIEIRNSINDHFFRIEPLTRYFSWPLIIVVIDERIQDHAENETYYIDRSDDCKVPNPCYCDTGIPYKILYSKTNILVPPKKNCNLNEQNFNDSYKEIINYIQDKAKSKSAEFLVIHLGIIEKLISAFNESSKSKSYNKDNEISDFIKNIICFQNGYEIIEYDKIIITSGRGVPHNLPEDIRYVNFSIVSQCLIDVHNKFAFTEALYSSRRIIKN